MEGGVLEIEVTAIQMNAIKTLYGDPAHPNMPLEKAVAQVTGMDEATLHMLDFKLKVEKSRGFFDLTSSRPSRL